MSQLSQNVPTISKCPNYLKLFQLSQNVPAISKCPNYLKMSQLTISKFSNFHQRENLREEYIFLMNNSLDKNKDCAEICEMNEFMRNYAENVKICKNVR